MRLKVPARLGAVVLPFLAPASTAASQVPALAAPVHGDQGRVYVAEQFSNTVSVVDPADNRVLGAIRLGDPAPANFSPLYRGQLLVHGLGFSPDGKTLVVVSVGSNGVTFIDTASNSVKGTTYVGRSPHEAVFTPDGSELWVSVRGEDYLAVLDATTRREKARVRVPPGPGMTIFSPDGAYAYVCSSFTPRTTVIRVADREVVGGVTQPSSFCPNIAAAPEGDQVWFTLKDVGQTIAFNARPPFDILKVIDTGPITNHVNFVRRSDGQHAFVTVGGLNEVQVYRTRDFARIATIPVGKLPHGLWPSDDGRRVYVGLENEDALAVIDTETLKVVEKVKVGQAPQAVVYVPGAASGGSGKAGLQGAAPRATQTVELAAPGQRSATSVALFDQGLVQILQASVSGLAPKTPYVLALAAAPDGGGPRHTLATFTTNPAGGAIVNTIGPIREVVTGASEDGRRRYLVVTTPDTAQPGSVVQLQVH